MIYFYYCDSCHNWSYIKKIPKKQQCPNCNLVIDPIYYNFEMGPIMASEIIKMLKTKNNKMGFISYEHI